MYRLIWPSICDSHWSFFLVLICYNDTISLKKRTSLKSKITKKLFPPRNGVCEVEIVLACLSSKPLSMSLITRVVMLLKRLQRSIVRGEQGGRSGESTHLSPMWPGFEPRRWRHMWVEFVVGSLSCSERLFSGFSGFSLSLKTKISKFQFDLERTDTFQRIECSMGKQITNNNKLPRKFF